MTQDLLARLGAHMEETGLSKSGVAKAAGLHPNTLRAMGTAEWNPTADTVARLEDFLTHSGQSPLVGIEEIINEARNGRMYILVDDEDRENEGDLIIPGQMATPDAINFMARNGRGLICLALGKERTEQLGLSLMTRHNRSRNETAFTVSIEARDGITTGISAADRARTVAVAIDSAQPAEAIVSPGHVFPLVAREGGVLVRAGHTEAAVDVSRLAGLNPSGVICEVMNEDGTMARLDDLIPFARKHGLKIGTIRDLIAYRMCNDHLVQKTAETEIDSEHGGRWKVIGFVNKASHGEHIVLVKGRLDPAKPTLVRVHVLSAFPDLLRETGGRADLIPQAMDAIAAEGAGVLILIGDIGGPNLARQVAARGAGMPYELREYGVGAQILVALGVTDMILLSGSHRSYVGLEGYGLRVVGERPLVTTEEA